jgi:hypothetical protein
MKRNHYIKLIFIAFIILTSLPAFAQENPKEFVTKFFNEYKNEGAAIAIENLYSTNIWMERQADGIVKIKNQLEGLTEDYVGKYYGYELIIEKQLSESFIQLSYLVKFDRQPIRFTFQFYKPNDKWTMHSFKFDGDVGLEIEEAAKLYYLNLDD